jgi:hypothetical protein
VDAESRTLVQRLEDALENAARACCTARPTTGDDVAYQYGRLQGKFAGLSEALRIVQDLEDDQFEDDEEPTETGAS